MILRFQRLEPIAVRARMRPIVSGARRAQIALDDGKAGITGALLSPDCIGAQNVGWPKS
jgi:hypothetical protein